MKITVWKHQSVSVMLLDITRTVIIGWKSSWMNVVKWIKLMKLSQVRYMKSIELFVLGQENMPEVQQIFTVL